MFKDFRVYLRALELDDYKTSIKWRNDNEIWQMVGGPKHFVSEAYEKKWVEEAIFSRDSISLAICLKESNEYIGNAYINDIDWINKSAHAPSMIGEKKYWSSGLATEARILLLYFAFHERGFNRIWASILEDNIGSQRMCEKCGYKKEGILRNSIYKNGEFKNQIIMSVLREEFDEVLTNISNKATSEEEVKKSRKNTGGGYNSLVEVCFILLSNRSIYPPVSNKRMNMCRLINTSMKICS